MPEGNVSGVMSVPTREDVVSEPEQSLTDKRMARRELGISGKIMADVHRKRCASRQRDTHPRIRIRQYAWGRPMYEIRRITFFSVPNIVIAFYGQQPGQGGHQPLYQDQRLFVSNFLIGVQSYKATNPIV